jgi:outer membrane murein-binding lipoprotein Lpp
MEKEHLEIILEDILGKFDLVLEGHEMLRNEIREVQQESNARHDHTAFLLNTLNDKIDGVDAKLDSKIDKVEVSLSDKIDRVEASLSSKIDAVAADLKAHRADTEAHHGVYRVKEG